MERFQREHGDLGVQTLRRADEMAELRRAILVTEWTIPGSRLGPTGEIDARNPFLLDGRHALDWRQTNCSRLECRYTDDQLGPGKLASDSG